MGKVLKWIGIVLGGLVGTVVLAVLFLFVRSSLMLNEMYEAPADSVAIPTDEASLERGRHIVTTLADCVGCHGENLGGGVVVDDPALGRIVAPNLTTGENGFGDDLSDADFVQIIRYGVMPDGKSARVMPSYDYYYMSDEDLGAVIAYIRSVPPVDSNLGESELRPFGRILLAAGQLPILSAARVDRSAAQFDVEPAGTAEYGHYIARLSCMGCHGEGLSGGQILGAPPGWPQAANLTPGGEVGSWSEADFVQTIRTGVNPAGHELNPEMPWMVFRNLSDEELHAIWLYLESVPAKGFGNH